MTSLAPPNIPLSENSPPLRVALQAAAAGGQIVADYFHQGVQVWSKSEQEPQNLVSRADLESEQKVAEIIRGYFPDHQIVGEEQAKGSIDADHVWIIDPLDGTNNFAHRIPQFAVSIGYYQSGKAQCGVVFNPIRGDWYWAVRGQGAYHNHRRLSVSAAQQLSETLVGVGFYYDRGVMMEATLRALHDFFKAGVHGTRRFGAASLDLCMVADGMLGAFFEYHLSPWDFAAGGLIVQEAGGKITTARGHPLPLQATSVLASNNHIHTQALAIVDTHHP